MAIYVKILFSAVSGTFQSISYDRTKIGDSCAYRTSPLQTRWMIFLIYSTFRPDCPIKKYADRYGYHAYSRKSHNRVNLSRIFKSAPTSPYLKWNQHQSFPHAFFFNLLPLHLAYDSSFSHRHIVAEFRHTAVSRADDSSARETKLLIAVGTPTHYTSHSEKRCIDFYRQSDKVVYKA